MDWALAIRRNREALLRVLAALFSLVGLDEDESARGAQGSTLPRHLHAQVQRILRAAESAIRRLIVVAARDITVQPRSGGGALRPDFGGKHSDAADAPAVFHVPAFPLLDPLKRFSFRPPRRASKFFPRICVVGVSVPAPMPEKPVLLPDDPVDAAGLYRRLLSSRRALNDLPRQARRLARWKARNKLRREPGHPGRVLPLRLGRPPGLRKRPLHAVDDILKECHALAIDAMSLPDTS